MPTLISILKLPASTSALGRCLQWTAEGQLCVVTKAALHVFTPDYGINYDLGSTIKLQANADQPPATSVGWFKTMVQLTDLESHRWHEHSHSWATVSLGALDLSIAEVASSPSNVSQGDRCLIAIRTTNYDVSIWAAGSNFLKGQMREVANVTDFLLDEASTRPPMEAAGTSSVTRAQITAIAWTPPCDFGYVPSPLTDTSFFITGNRSGSLLFFQYGSNSSQALTLVQEVNLSKEEWITKITCTSWRLLSTGQYEIRVAYVLSDGTLGVVRAIQSSTSIPSPRNLGPRYTFNLQVSPEPQIAHAGGGGGVTALKWVTEGSHTEPPLLAFAKPGRIGLVYPPSSSHPLSSSPNLRVFQIPTLQARPSTMTSPLHPAVGLQYVKERDSLIVALYDGSIHVLGDISTAQTRWIMGDVQHPSQADFASAPQVPPLAKEHSLSTSNLTKVVRRLYVETETAKVDFSDANAISAFVDQESHNGAVSDGVFLWLHQTERPADFSYKHEAKHRSVITIASLWDTFDPGIFMHKLDEVVHSRAVIYASPIHLLRPFFLQLRSSPDRFFAIESSLRAFLGSSASSPAHLAVGVHTVDHTLVQRGAQSGGALEDLGINEIRADVQESLRRSLFGDPALTSLRMKLSLAAFAWDQLIDDNEKQKEIGQLSQGILTEISHRFLRIMTQHILAVSQYLTVEDVRFVVRISIQSLLPGSPPDLVASSNNLDALTVSLTNAASAPPSIPIDPSLDNSRTEDVNERCPACGVEIPLENITSSVCSNGHTWPRCSITSFILSTARVQTCVGCGRKAFLPVAAEKASGQGQGQGTPRTPAPVDPPVLLGGWFVQDLLRCVDRCLFCNNAFVRVL